MSITADYVYGVIQFTSRNEPTLRAPVVSAAPTAIPNPTVLPEKATANVSAGDPDAGPLPLFFTWSKVSGAGTVTFSPNSTAAAASSSASFSLPGPYILRVEISDGMSEAVADVGILATDGGTPSNTAPAVSAGPSSTVVFPALAQLKGMVLDDGLPGVEALPPARRVRTLRKVWVVQGA